MKHRLHCNKSLICTVSYFAHSCLDTFIMHWMFWRLPNYTSQLSTQRSVFHVYLTPLFKNNISVFCWLTDRFSNLARSRVWHDKPLAVVNGGGIDESSGNSVHGSTYWSVSIHNCHAWFVASSRVFYHVNS